MKDHIPFLEGNLNRFVIGTRYSKNFGQSAGKCSPYHVSITFDKELLTFSPDEGYNTDASVNIEALPQVRRALSLIAKQLKLNAAIEKHKALQKAAKKKEK